MLGQGYAGVEHVGQDYGAEYRRNGCAAVNNGSREIVCHGLGKTVYNSRIKTLEAKDLATHNASYARGAKLLWAMMVEEVQV